MKNPEAFAAVTIAATIASGAVGHALHDVGYGVSLSAVAVLAIIFGLLGYAAADKS